MITLIKKYEWANPRDKFGLPVWRLNKILAIIQIKMQNLTEDNRDFPVNWSVMHMYSTMQLAKLVALKRGLEPDLAALTCAFHDIYSLLKGKTEDHGIKAEPYIREIILEYNSEHRESLPEITAVEQEQIFVAVKNHSDKNKIDDDSYGKLLKDVDSIDSYLHGMTPGRKSGRIPRGNEVLKEFSIDHQIER